MLMKDLGLFCFVFWWNDLQAETYVNQEKVLQAMGAENVEDMKENQAAFMQEVKRSAV